jgi:hypothetical protein
VADEVTSLYPHDAVKEQSLADSSNHFYLDLNYTNIRIYHQDSVFTLRGLFPSSTYGNLKVKIGLQGKGDDEMFSFWITAKSFQQLTYSYDSTPISGILTFYLPNDFK